MRHISADDDVATSGPLKRLRDFATKNLPESKPDASPGFVKYVFGLSVFFRRVDHAVFLGGLFRLIRGRAAHDQLIQGLTIDLSWLGGCGIIGN